MTTATDICNLALIHVGGLKIASLEENNESARNCRIIYPIARDQTLRDHPWGFAEKRRKLSLIADLEIAGFDYGYQYPQDCIHAREIFRGIRSNPPLEFRVLRPHDHVTRVIAANVPDAILIYTARITDEDQFNAQFITALSWRIAVDLAMPLTKKTAIQNLAEQTYVKLIAQAATSENLESEDPAPDQFRTFLKARM